MIAADHPEAFCERCRRPNISWSAPSPVWNAVLRAADGSDEWGILCPVCFAELAEARLGESLHWYLEPEPFPDVSLVTPDGRRWDFTRRMWGSPPPDPSR